MNNRKKSMAEIDRGRRAGRGSRRHSHAMVNQFASSLLCAMAQSIPISYRISVARPWPPNNRWSATVAVIPWPCINPASAI